MRSRRLFIAGNWKMFLTTETAGRLARALADRIGNESALDVGVCPPFPYLLIVHEVTKGTQIRLAAQNLFYENEGAFTGEVSAQMLIDCGCKYVLVGHSEQRKILGENDELIQRKARAALQKGLKPILCIGETLEERQAGKTFAIVDAQLKHGLVGVPPEQLREITIAYEPVWAIGTGKVATPEQAEEVHAHIRATLTASCGADLAQVIRIQYGGSVNAGNAHGLLSMPNVDGALVGGASLKADEFAEIVKIALACANA